MREPSHVELGGFGRGLLLDLSNSQIGPLRPPRNPPFWHYPLVHAPEIVCAGNVNIGKGRDLTLGLVV